MSHKFCVNPQIFTSSAELIPFWFLPPVWRHTHWNLLAFLPEEPRNCFGSSEEIIRAESIGDDPRCVSSAPDRDQKPELSITCASETFLQLQGIKKCSIIQMCSKIDKNCIIIISFFFFLKGEIVTLKVLGFLSIRKIYSDKRIKGLFFIHLGAKVCAPLGKNKRQKNHFELFAENVRSLDFAFWSWKKKKILKPYMIFIIYIWYDIRTKVKAPCIRRRS